MSISMKKYIVTTIALFVCAYYANGQANEEKINTQSALELNHVRSLWANSSNAAGMAFYPLHDYNIVSGFYNYEIGEYKWQQEGDNYRNIGFNTKGALRLGKMALWGNFGFSDSYTTASKFNTNSNDLSPDMPYYVADSIVSDWRRQYYDMALKAALPLGDRLSVGVELEYLSREGAKQRDPSSVVDNRKIVVTPSIVLKLNDRHTIGANFRYYSTFDRNTWESNYSMAANQQVYKMKGLGNYVLGINSAAAGQQIEDFYTNGEAFGGGLQYGGLFGSNTEVLLDVTLNRKKTETYESATKPMREGDTYSNTWNGTLQVLHKGDITHRLLARVNHSSTDGVEHIQKFNDTYEVQFWETVTTFVKSTYLLQTISMQYDIFVGAHTDYLWKFGLDGVYANREDTYLLPRSEFYAKNFYLGWHINMNVIELSSSKLNLGFNSGYKKSIDGHYFYEGGTDSAHPIITNFYQRDLAYITDNYWQLGLNVDWSIFLKSRSTINAGVGWKLINPQKLSSDRCLMAATLAFIF